MIVFASHNPGKIREINTWMNAYISENIVGLDKFGIPDIEETGTTYVENALIKARTVANITGLISIADDSGIEIDALNGAPGVYSARFSNDIPLLEGENIDQRNVRKTLSIFKEKGITSSKAKYICTLAVVNPFTKKEFIVTGTWKGKIITTPKGTNGFGYDPIFFDESFQKTSAELTAEEKHTCSHRAMAIKQLAKIWSNIIS